MTDWTSDPSFTMVPHLQAHIPFHSPPFYRPLQFGFKRLNKPIKAFYFQLSAALLKETDSSEWRETSYYVMTTQRAGQVRGEMNPRPLWAAECAGDHGLLMNSRTAGQCIWWPLVSFAGQQTDVSLTQSALTGWPVEALEPQGRCWPSGPIKTGSWHMKMPCCFVLIYAHLINNTL